jgi:hypothetical protein
MRTDIFQVNFGCDPELFFKQNGKIIGSEKVLSKNGLEQLSNVVEDGIQVEIHPSSTSCREILAGNIRDIFYNIRRKIKDTDIELDFNSFVNIDIEEMESLSEKSKQFGCATSKNIYDKNAKIEVSDPSKYYFRSAGGHIHLGVDSGRVSVVHDNIVDIVKLLDIIVGNTCVLLDREKGNIERRKNYGRAGEFRIKNYGLEYRTLSNFWLRHCTLMSLVFGLSRYAVSIWRSNQAKDFLKSVNYEDVRKAIDTNNITLARKNFNKIKKLLPQNNIKDILTGEEYYYKAPLTQENLEKFEQFTKIGIKKIFKEDPLNHWADLRIGGNGWESFIKNFNKNSYVGK